MGFVTILLNYLLFWQGQLGFHVKLLGDMLLIQMTVTLVGMHGMKLKSTDIGMVLTQPGIYGYPPTIILSKVIRI